MHTYHLVLHRLIEHMDSFIVNGGKRLSGTIVPRGAKNEALQVISAVLLTAQEVIISNIPDIIDVNNLIKLITDLGVATKQLNDNTYSFCAKDVNIDFLNSEQFKSQPQPTGAGKRH